MPFKKFDCTALNIKPLSERIHDIVLDQVLLEVDGEIPAFEHPALPVKSNSAPRSRCLDILSQRLNILSLNNIFPLFLEESLRQIVVLAGKYFRLLPHVCNQFAIYNGIGILVRPEITVDPLIQMDYLDVLHDIGGADLP